jgi:hypothetical protein
MQCVMMEIPEHSQRANREIGGLGKETAQPGLAAPQIERGPRLGREPRKCISFPGAEAGAWGHPSSFPLRGR